MFPEPARKKVDASKWGTQLSKKLKHSKRLPVHYAAENKSPGAQPKSPKAKKNPTSMVFLGLGMFRNNQR